MDVYGIQSMVYGMQSVVRNTWFTVCIYIYMQFMVYGKSYEYFTYVYGM